MAKSSRVTTIAAIVCLQAVAAVFFVADAYGDLQAEGATGHLAVEGLIAAALVIGVILNALEVRRLLQQRRKAQITIRAASGALAEVIQLRFREWGLTPAEGDVALLALKGLTVEEIARLRHSAPGTVRAQLTHVYSKAGVGNRAGLFSLFIDDLLNEPLTTSH